MNGQRLAALAALGLAPLLLLLQVTQRYLQMPLATLDGASFRFHQ